MSGGVDSSVAALLLKQAGYEVVGLFMKLWHDPCGTKQNACCDDAALADARRVADKLEIPFYEVDARSQFKDLVTDYFIDEYKNIRTPNPCVVCNKKIKFGWLLEFAEKLGCDFLATGHYCRITNDHAVISTPSPMKKGGVGEILSKDLSTPLRSARDDKEDISYHLLKGTDSNKDQSYFMYQLNQTQLSKIIFPVGEMTKDEVRQIARDNNLEVAEKRESQEVCFISDNDYRAFLARNAHGQSFEPGKIVDVDGEIIGEHDGLVNYTIGQRKGIPPVHSTQYAVRSETKPQYVIGFDRNKNELIVGDDEELYRKEFIIEDAYWIAESLELKAKSDLTVKVRSHAEEIPCEISVIRNTKYAIRLKTPVRAVTPGQSAVLYNRDEVIGGGVIQ